MTSTDANQRWLDARERMRPYVHAVFWQELGVDQDRLVDWILDRIVRPEFLQLIDAGPQKWSVWRMDDNGSRFEVSRDLSLAEANTRLEQLERSGHKQHYWIACSR